jgi:hypothetical protein
VQLEPLGPRLPCGPGPSKLTSKLTTSLAPPLGADDLRLAAAAGAAALVVLSTGDAFLLAFLLGVAAWRVAAGATGMLVAVMLLARWGSSSLAAAAGAQAVLGPALVVGPWPALVSTWCAVAALLLAAPVGLAAPIFGAAAALVAAGPGATSAENAAARIAALAVGAAAAYILVPRVDERVRRAAPVLAALSAALVVLW